MNLNDRKWGIFLIGDLFCVKRPPARNKIIMKSEMFHLLLQEA